MDVIQDLNFDSATILILLGGICLSALIIALLLYIRHLRAKVDSFENPSYGFLGKTIYPLIGFIMLGSVLFIAGYGIISPDTADIQADVNMEGEISATVKSQTLALVNTELKFVPYVNGQPWGGVGDTFDLYWRITGPIIVEEFELGSSKFKPSSLEVSLPKGTYFVEIRVIYLGESYTFTDRITY